MSWRGRLILALSVVALVGATFLAIHLGRSGTPATTVLDTSPAQLADVTSTVPARSCVLPVSTAKTADVLQVSGACTGILDGAASCGDATGNVALAVVSPAGEGATLSLLVQFNVDPLTAGLTSASVFVELARANGFDRWSNRAATVDVSANGVVPLHDINLMPEAGTNATPVTLDGTARCATGS